MQRISSDLFFSPSDSNHFVECEHLTALDLLALDGHGLRKEKDPQAEIIRAKGLEHEQAWLHRLVAEGRQVVSIADTNETDWARDAARTEQAMRDGAEVIDQGVFVDAPWRGDRRLSDPRERPLAAGRMELRSLGREARAPSQALLHPAALLVQRAARTPARRAAGAHARGPRHRRDGVVRPAGLPVVLRSVRGRLLRALAERRETYPSPVGHCHVCGYASHCEQQREADDHLSLVAGLRHSQVERLAAVQVTTVEQLGRLDPTLSIGITPQALDRLVRQARLQVEARTGPHRYELLAPEPKRGLGLLAAPSAGDVFFDIEGYPFFETARGLEYSGA